MKTPENKKKKSQKTIQLNYREQYLRLQYWTHLQLINLSTFYQKTDLCIHFKLLRTHHHSTSKSAAVKWYDLNATIVEHNSTIREEAGRGMWGCGEEGKSCPTHNVTYRQFSWLLFHTKLIHIILNHFKKTKNWKQQKTNPKPKHQTKTNKQTKPSPTKTKHKSGFL